jgi:hypothetical protein
MSATVATFPTNDNHQTITLEGVTGRFVRLRPALTNSDNLNISQIILKDVNGNTLTNATTPVRASSLFVYNGTPAAKPGCVVNPSGFTAGPGVNWSVSSWASNLWHSAGTSPSEFIEIDLGTPKTIASIEVYSRTEPGSPTNSQYWRMLNVRVEVDNTSVGNDYTLFQDTDYPGQGDLVIPANGTIMSDEQAMAIANGTPNCTGFSITSNRQVWFKNTSGLNTSASAGTRFYRKGGSIQATASAAEASAAQASATEESATEAAEADEGAEAGEAQPSAAQESAAQPSAAQPSAAQESAAQPSAAQPSAAQPSAAQASAAQPSAPTTLQEPFESRMTAQPPPSQVTNISYGAYLKASAAQITNTYTPNLQASAAQESTAQGIFNTTGYLSLTGPVDFSIIPPYEFQDDFVAFNEQQLRAMSLSQLYSYRDTLTTSIDLEYSTIHANQKLQNRYNLLARISQSTIDGLNNETSRNNAEQFASEKRKSYLQELSSIYADRIAGGNADIDTQNVIIDSIISTISSYSTELSSIESTISGDYSTFVSSAEGYSTAYYAAMARDSLAAAKKQELDEANLYLSDLAYLESTAYANYLESTFLWEERNRELNTLSETTESLRKRLATERTQEADAMRNYESSIVGVCTLSTLLGTAEAAHAYAIAHSSMMQYANEAADAQRIYEAALIAYENSLPQTGGKKSYIHHNTYKGGAILGNTTLWQALQMADQAKEAALSKKSAADDNANRLRTLAGIAQTDTYGATLAALEATVISKMRLANTYMKYKLSSIEGVAKFSSLYDQAVLDISTYDGMIALYSSFYESSFAGASTLLGLATEDEADADANQAEADAISHRMSSMIDEYNQNTSTYDGYIKLSSFYLEQLAENEQLLSSLSSFYDSTNEAIDKMNSELSILNMSLITTDAKYFAESSILNLEMIQQNIFRTQILDSVNSQETAGYSYRETYCRLRRIDLETNYESLVLNAVQYASTQTGIAQQSSSTPLPDVAINLNTPDIVASYTTLVSLNNFMDSFSTVYNVYNIQSSNVAVISTSLGAQKNALSTFSFYDAVAYYTKERIPDIQNVWASASADYEIKKEYIPNVIQTYSNTQQTISTTKQNFSIEYSGFFTREQMIEQDIEISSFIIQGYEDAIANLASQGINFSL